jgi:predicted enzyme related to lactoylglutathione lyase
MKSGQVSAVLFVKDLAAVAAFYAKALGMNVVAGDEYHTRLDCVGFELVVQQIPRQIADGISIDRPPQRRTTSAMRLDYPVRDIVESRRLARSLGGGIDDAPPGWASPNASFFFGYDPEGNQFGVMPRVV